MRLLCAGLLIIALTVSSSHAGPMLFSNTPAPENPWVKEKEEGWYFYNERTEPEPVEEEPEPSPPPITQAPQAKPPETPPSPPVREEAKPKPLTVAWFHKHYEEVLRRAIDNPTPENVKAYLFLQRVILDKSTNFAYAVRNAVQSEPLLDENIRIPLASAMRAAMLNRHENIKEDALRYLSQRAGLWYIYRSSCHFCEWQYPQVRHFAEKYGFRLIHISQDGMSIPSIPEDKVLPDLGQSRTLGIQVVPALALLVPEKQEIIVLAQGTLSLEGIEQRTLTALLERHLLPRDLEVELDIYRRGLLTPEQIASAPEDPVQLINYIQTELEQSWVQGGSYDR